MILEYSISSLNQIAELPKLRTAQITLNGRQFPSKRQTVSLLRRMSPYHNTKIIIHYDFIYVASRFAMFNDSVQDAIVNEIVDILKYSETDKLVSGIVMHTDFPIKKKYVNNGKIKPNVSESYTGTLWNTDAVVELTQDLDTLLVKNLDHFYNKIKEKYTGSTNCKIFLENTTHVPDYNDTIGSVSYLKDYIIKNNRQDLFGLCYDTEHGFAVDGVFPSIELLSTLNKELPLMVHLNTIPKGIKPKSKKDRHSTTTIYDCSVNSAETYLEYVSFLRESNILFVREVKEDTMFEEVGIYTNYNS